MLLVLLWHLCSAVNINQVHSQGAPPFPIKSATMRVQNNLLIIFGGKEDAKTLHNSIYTYDLQKNTWNKIRTVGTVYPDPRFSLISFVNGLLYCIYGGNSLTGTLLDSWCININYLAWMPQTLTGSTPSPRYMNADTQFTWNNTNYFALYGGYKTFNISSGIHLFDIANMKFIDKGQGPDFLASSSMVFYNGFLYVIGGIRPVGYNTNLYKYDLAADNWTTVSCKGSYNPRSLAGAGVFDGYLYYFPGWSDANNVIETQIVRTNLNGSCEWEVLSSPTISDFALEGYAYVSYNNKFYMFGGRSNQTLENKIIELTPGSVITSNILCPTYITPGDIMSASLEYMSGSLYLFGGSVGNKKLNDLWRYDLQTLTWTDVKYFGTMPPPRSSHASTSQGDIMVIWGGKSDTGYYNDGYAFDVNTGTWTMLEAISGSPSARSDCCLVMDLPKIYIYGGVNNGEYSNTLWMYDIRTLMYTKGADSYGVPFASGQVCTLEMTENYSYMHVAYGLGIGDIPLGFVQSYDIKNNVWDVTVPQTDPVYARSAAAINMIGSKVFIIGGHTWGYIVHKEVMSIDLKTSKLNYIDDIPVRLYLTANTYVGNQFYIYGGGGVFDYIIRFNVAVDTFYTLNFFDLCGDSCNEVCSLGTYKAGTICKLCPAGSYSDNYGDSCTPCPIGTYSQKIGATSLLQCIPCAEGSFNDVLGSGFCKQCVSGYYCPVGSSTYYLFHINTELISVQPKIFERNTAEASSLTQKVQLSIFFGGLLILIVLMCAVKTRNALKDLDLYTNLHNFAMDHPLYKRRNLFGTVFSLLFILLALVLISQSLIFFSKDNQNETKSLVPLVILEKEVDLFKANITIELIMYNYGENILLNGSCNSVSFSLQNEIYYENDVLSCIQEESYSIAMLAFTECSLISSTVIQFKLEQRFSYSTAISVRVNSTSSIPGKVSSIQFSAQPKSGTVFRGYNPTVFSFALTPSFYRSKASGDNDYEETGYHVSAASSPYIGSYYAPNELGFTSGLAIDVELSKSISGLYTEKFDIQTGFLLLMTLLGSIPGIMSLMGALMAFVEGRYFFYKISAQKKQNFLELNRMRTINHSNFDETTECIESDDHLTNKGNLLSPR